METNLQNFYGKSLCRACMKNVDDPAISFIKNSDLINKYSTCTSIEVDFEDGLPLNLCQRCCSSLNEYYDFRKMCLESYQKMLSFKVGMKADDPDPGVSEPLGGAEYKIEIEEMFIPEDIADLAETKSDEKSFSSDSESATQHSSEDGAKDSKKKVYQHKNKAKTKDNTEKETPIKCSKCPKKFFERIRYEGHLRQHDGLKPYVCDICEKEFTNNFGYRVHKKNAHMDKDSPRISCTIEHCDKTFKTQITLQHHIKVVHQGIKSALCVCELCGKTLSSRNALTKHMNAHAGIRTFACDQCPKKFARKCKLNEHLLRHSGIKNFTCGICGLKQITRYELNKHMKTHNPEKNYKCELCTSAFSKVAYLNRHIANRHIHKKYIKFPCTYCDLSFGKPDTLKYHLMIHTGEKPEICPICDKRFRQRLALKTHMKTHNEIEN